MQVSMELSARMYLNQLPDYEKGRVDAARDRLATAQTVSDVLAAKDFEPEEIKTRDGVLYSLRVAPDLRMMIRFADRIEILDIVRQGQIDALRGAGGLRAGGERRAR